MLESGDPNDPQSWHRYAYAFNNPLRYIDPTGGENEAANEEEQKKKARTIKFEVLGRVKILGKNVTVYVATGQTKEYRDQVLKNAQGAADLINSKASSLTKEDKQIIGNITALAAPGADFQTDERFYARGIPGEKASELNSRGVNLQTGAYISVNMTSGAEVLASNIGHEGKHIQDYNLRIGGYGPKAPGDPLERSDLNERRALRYQLGLYRKLTGSSQSNPDNYDKYLQVLIKTPHRPPALKK